MGVSFCKAGKHSTFLNERWSLTRLRGIYAMVGKWGKLTYQPGSLLLICQKQLQKIKIIVLKWVITYGQKCEN